MNDSTRDAMHRAFAELRDADQHSTPGFDALVQRPRAVSRPRRALSGALVFAATLVVLAVIVRRPQNKPPVQSLSEWRAPTDVLLHTPGVEVLRSVPSLQSSVVDRFHASFTDSRQELR